MPSYDYDIFGYCVLCSKQVVVKEHIDKREIFRSLSDHEEESVLLSDNSVMRICVCSKCRPEVPKNFPMIMTKVYKGWEHELKSLDWTPEKKKEYLDKYSKLSIVKVTG